jgi:hypothetical protein
MNTIDVLKQSLAMLEELTSLGDFGGSVRYDINKTITALEQAIKQEALNLKAENARELGLDYEPENTLKEKNEGTIR